MTIVEFFDGEVLENVTGTLMLKPERTVFLSSSENCNEFIKRFGRVLKDRRIKTELVCEKTDFSTVLGAYQKIEECMGKYPDCHFDISGGTEIMLVAIGIARAKLNAPIYSLDAAKQTVTSMSGISYAAEKVNLTVDELITLHGGRRPSDKRPPETYSWEYDKRAESDTDKVWGICRSDCGAWNAALGTARGYRAEKRPLMTAIWYKLKAEGLVKKTDTGVKYKNRYVEYLLQKQGTVLEMYTYMAAKLACDKDGSQFFPDGESSCVIHWQDAVENEIDVLLVRGTVGYFISCKNGSVISDELYKLSIVAERFGGKYAKKILVLSHFEPDNSFLERAKELDIKIVKNVRSMSKKALAKKLAEA